MDNKLTPLSGLDAAGLQQLADLHCAVMQTLLSELGAPMVLRYYQLAQSNASALGLCTVSNLGTITGWAMGSPQPAALNASLRQPIGWFIGQILKLAFSRPGVLISLLRSLLSSSDPNRLSPGQIELTYIGVAPEAQGHGLGKTLLESFCESARQAGYTSIGLSVETDNLVAIQLYGRAGFKIAKTFHEGSFERHRMELSLA
ncbi:MAG: GNAT family N-acetyltransferase [Chloroflexi bacterium]|nr:GNAT family N-acetyltransferase [Chloroflexota bacterium]